MLDPMPKLDIKTPPTLSEAMLLTRIEELEAKLTKCVLVEYDNDDVISLSSFAGGASEGGAWSTLTLMKEEANGDISFREYKAVNGWETTLAELTGGKQ